MGEKFVEGKQRRHIARHGIALPNRVAFCNRAKRKACKRKVKRRSVYPVSSDSQRLRNSSIRLLAGIARRPATTSTASLAAALTRSRSRSPQTGLRARRYASKSRLLGAVGTSGRRYGPERDRGPPAPSHAA